MTPYRLEREQWVPGEPSEIFDSFARAPALAVRAALAAFFDYRYDRIRAILGDDGDDHGHR